MQTEDYPALYASSDELSARAQRRFHVLLRSNLALLVLAALLSVGATDHWGLAVLQATTLLLALATTVASYFYRSERVWYSARALAESIKTLAWRFMARAEPFDLDDLQADRLLQNRLAETIRQNRSLAGRFQTGLARPQVSDEMRRVRSLNLADRISFYRLHRIVDQRNWYAAKATHNVRNGALFFYLVVAANGIAVVFALLKIRFPESGYWPTDVLVTLASAILAYIQSKRFSELAASYALTAHEIGIVEEQLRFVVEEADFSSFVGDAENAFSREHTQWEARKDV